MNRVDCSICNIDFDIDTEGDRGFIGLIPFAFCPTCRVGIWEWAQVSFDLVPAGDEDPAQTGRDDG